MEKYIGLDVHATSCSIAVLSSSGKRLAFEVVETNGAALLEAFKRIRGVLYVCMEEGTQSTWLYNVLRPAVSDIVVIAESERKGRAAGNKNDAEDAFGLAEMLRTGSCKRKVFKELGEFKKLRALVKAYGFMTEDLVRCQNRLKAAYRSEGVRTSGTEIYRKGSKEEWLPKLPQEHHTAVDVLHQSFETLLALKADAERAMIAEARKHEAFELLQTIPGFGPIRSAQVLSVVVTPLRFRTKRQFWPYCGLAIVTSTSNDYEQLPNGKWVRKKVLQTRGLNKNHNPLMKNVMKGAAMTVVQKLPSSRLYADYQRLLRNGVKPNLAMLTLSRKIAAIVLAIWKSGKPYEYSVDATQTEDLVENQALNE